MNYLKRCYKILALALVLSMFSTLVLPANNTMIAQAATVKLSDKKITLGVGSTKLLTVTGTKSRVVWTSSKATIATVSKTGQVTAKKEGTTTITAVVSKKEYTCKVTVYKIKTVTSGAVTYVIPNNWTSKVVLEQGNNISVAAYPKTADTTVGSSNVAIAITETGTEKPDYSIIKSSFEAAVTEDLLVSQFAQSGMEASINNFNTSDFETNLGTAFQISYKAKVSAAGKTQTMSQVLYELYIDNYLIEVSVTDIGDNITPDVYGVGETLLNSIEIAK